MKLEGTTVSVNQTLRKVGPLLSLFRAEYLRKTGGASETNAIQAKWALVDIIEDIGAASARETIQYFFKIPRDSYEFSEFTKMYNKIHANIIREQQDKALRAKLREKTRRLVEGNK